MKKLVDCYVDRGQRISLAAKRAGLSPGQVGKKMDWPKSKTEPIFGGIAHAAYALTHNEICRLAYHLDVDARWLATGVQSPAGEACVANLRRLRQKGEARFDRITQQDFDAICNTLLLSPQPETGFPECRYCHCTEVAACPDGCGWADDDCTICTACLEILEEDES